MSITLPHIPGFEVHRLLGRGGMGAVYDTTDGRSGRPAALKVLSLEHLTEAGRHRFEREARAMMSVQHPNVCAAYDFGVIEDDGRLYLAMERLYGEDLWRRLGRDGRLTPALVARYGAQAAAGLGAAHRAGLVHRDVKPSNLFLHRVGDEYVVKVLDFGLAVATGGGARITRTGEILGTPGYMAPEQATGQRSEGPRTDVFGLGAVLYHALSGVAPYGDDAPLAIVVRMLTEDPPPLIDICGSAPPALVALITACLERDQANRPGSMAEVAATLSLLMEDGVDLELPLGLADTGSVRYSRPTLVDEQRLLTALVATGVVDVPTVVDSIRSHGGRAVEVAPGHVIGLYGADELEGDEAERAVQTALAVRTGCSSVGVGTGHAQHGRGRVSSEALTMAATLSSRAEPGSGAVHVDELTRQRLGGRYSTDANKVLGPVVVEPPAGRMPFVGREAELADIGGRAHRAFDDEEPAGVLVLGAPGVGKTRLVQELVAQLRTQEPALLVLTARGATNRRYSSWHAIGAALRELGGVSEDTPAARCISVMREIAATAGLEAHAGYFLAAALGVPLPEGSGAVVDNARRDPKAMRHQIVAAVGDLIEARAGNGAILLVVEDAQWADTASLELIDVLVSRIDQAPLFVLMTGRPHTVDDRPELFDAPRIVERRLEELSRRSAARLAEEALGALRGELGTAVVEAIAEHAAGNPFFVIEIVAHVAERVARFGPEAFDPLAFALPLTVEAAVQSRLDHLPGSDKDLLKRASVYGDRFWSAALDVPEANAILKRLRRRRLIQRPARRDARLAGQEEWAFRHRVVRDVAFGMLTRSQRQGLHLQAGRWLDEVAKAPADEVAHHFTEGGALLLAAPLWARAGEQAARDGDLRGAMERFDRALAANVEPALRAEVQVRKAGVASDLGEYMLAEELLGSLGQDLQPRVRADRLFCAAQVQLATAGVSRDEHTRVLHKLEEAAQLYEALGDRLLQVRTLAAMGMHTAYGGAGSALEYAERAVEVAGDERAARGHALGSLATVLMRSGDLSGAARASERAAADAAAVGNLALELAVLGDLGWLQMQLGAFAAAVDALRSVVTQAQRVGHRAVEGYAWHNLGLALLHMGDVEGAVQAEDRALEMAEAASNTRLATYCQLYRTVILSEAGQLDAALAAGRAALNASEGGEDEVAARAALAHAHHAAGRLEEGLQEAERAQALRAAADGMMESEADLMRVHAELLLALGRVDEAAKVAGEGRVQVFRRAEAISETPAERERVLREIPAHRRILEMSE